MVNKCFWQLVSPLPYCEAIKNIFIAAKISWSAWVPIEFKLSEPWDFSFKPLHIEPHKDYNVISPSCELSDNLKKGTFRNEKSKTVKLKRYMKKDFILPSTSSPRSRSKRVRKSTRLRNDVINKAIVRAFHKFYHSMFRIKGNLEPYYEEQINFKLQSCGFKTYFDEKSESLSQSSYGMFFLNYMVTASYAWLIIVNLFNYLYR